MVEGVCVGVCVCKTLDCSSWTLRGLHTKSWPAALPRTLLKVFGGGGWWWLRVILVFTFGPKPQLKFGPS